ncbi:MAG: HD domain-containing protein, partial [Deltaproteobacteria bacterium]|nr:HD domain-containing protein [Deltaproteobacteria bacterium]
MIRLDDLINQAASYLPQDSNLELISKAYVYSATLHKDRYSPSGTPMLQHALEVAHILAGLKLDLTCILAGLLHDVLKEDLAKKGELESTMGPPVADLVEALSKISRASYHSSEESRANPMR